MNIFKALRKGNGKAVLPGIENYAKRTSWGTIDWYVENNSSISILPCHLESDDWLPYEEPSTSDVPRGTKGKKGALCETAEFKLWKAYFEMYFKLKNQGFIEEAIPSMIAYPTGINKMREY